MTVPGSKSGTNRALLLAALAEGTSVVTGALRSDLDLHLNLEVKVKVKVHLYKSKNIKNDDQIKKYVDNKEIIKTIYIENKLINFIIK